MNDSMNEQKPLAGRNALVTGGAGSLGRAIALSLRESGCQVAVLDQDAAELARFEAETGIAGVACDLLDATETELKIREIWDRFGPMSILVNAVGVIHSAPLLNISNATKRRHDVEAWRRVIEINLTAVFLATMNVVDRMVATRTRGAV